MLGKLIVFEWRYFSRQPSFFVTCFVFFLLPFLAMVVDQVQIGSGGNVLFNSPFAIAQILLILSIFSMFMVVNFVGNTAVRNHTEKMAEIIYTKPIDAFSYSLGRFIGAYLICVTVFAMVPLGTFLGTLMPNIDPERLGPNNLSFYLVPFLVFSITTLFIQAAVFYAVAQRFNSLMITYVVALGFFILYSVAGQIFDEPHERFMRAMLDPFGLNTFQDFTRYWTPQEKNTEVIGLNGIVLKNRALWLTVAVAVLFLGGRFFKPLSLLSKKAKKGKSEKKLETAPLNSSFDLKSEVGSDWERFKVRTSFEIKQIFKSPAFLIMLVFCAVQLVALMLTVSGIYGTANWPLTKNMVNLIAGAFSLLALIVVAYYTAEIVWRERSTGMGDITDSTATHNIVFWASKLIAVCAVLIALFSLGVVLAVAYQLFKGHADLELGQYAISLFYFYALPWFMLAILAFFIQVISPNKYVGIMIFVAYLLLQIVINQLGVEHKMWDMGGSPAFQYSDLNGYAHYVGTQAWYMLYWGAFFAIISILSYGLWRRGQDSSLKHRFAQIRYQIGKKGVTLVSFFAIAFVSLGSIIFYNTRVVNEFVGNEEAMDLQAEYEKKYILHKNDNIPIIKSMDVDVAIYPNDRRIDATAKIEILNKGKTEISRFMLNSARYAQSTEIEMDGLTMVEEDNPLNVVWYQFSKPLAPGERRKGLVKSVIDHQGFKDRNEDSTLVENGTFINNGELFPSIGYSRGIELVDQHERRKRDLEPIERAYPLEDKSHYSENAFDRSIDFIDFSATISTSSDQIAIAPGYLKRQWQDNGLNFYRYEMDQPMLNFFSINSGRLELKKDQHNDVAIEVYYHRGHDWNLDRMIESTKDSLDYFEDSFGEYQHQQFRIIEFPGYRTFAQSFANTIPYSEEIGFTADLRKDDNIDYVYYVTAHEMAHQWWGHQLGAANVQGAAVLSETLSQYSALMVMEREYGEAKLRRFLTYELDRYLIGRGSELIEEMPLLRAENQQYLHYQKGSVVMMALRYKLGEQHINNALRDLLEEYKYKSNPYPTTLDLVRHLSKGASAEEIQFINNAFEQITLYELRADEVTSEEMPNGKHKITFKVNAQQFSSDGKGVETEQNFSEKVEVAMFSNDPNDYSINNEILYNQQHQLISGENIIEIVVDEKPEYIGIDPFVRFIDRDTGNNILRL